MRIVTIGEGRCGQPIFDQLRGTRGVLYQGFKTPVSKKDIIDATLGSAGRERRRILLAHVDSGRPSLAESILGRRREHVDALPRLYRQLRAHTEMSASADGPRVFVMGQGRTGVVVLRVLQRQTMRARIRNVWESFLAGTAPNAPKGGPSIRRSLPGDDASLRDAGPEIVPSMIATLLERYEQRSFGLYHLSWRRRIKRRVIADPPPSPPSVIDDHNRFAWNPWLDAKLIARSIRRHDRMWSPADTDVLGTTLGGAIGSFVQAWLPIREVVMNGWLAEPAATSAGCQPTPGRAPWDHYSWSKHVADNLGIPVVTGEHEDLPACLIRSREQLAIHLDRGLSRERRAFAILHEVAHLFLGHRPSSDHGLATERLKRDDRQAFGRQEIEADALASRWQALLEELYLGLSSAAEVDAADPRSDEAESTVAEAPRSSPTTAPTSPSV